MAESKRQSIITAYENQLKGISVLGGYNTALGSNVQGWRAIPWAETETIGLDYRDEEEVLAEEEQPFDGEIHLLRIKNEILVVGSPADKRKALADFVKCLGTNQTLGGLCIQMMPIANMTSDTIHANKRAFLVTVVIDVKYQTGNFNPYS